MNTVWHKISESDYPQPFKQVLVLLNNSNRITLGWYEGETRKLQWHVENVMDVSSKEIKAWCNIPYIPQDLLN